MELPEYLFYRYKGGFKRIKFDEIFFIEADDNYVNVFTLSEKHIIRMSFDAIMKLLPREKFIQVHRSYAIAIDRIDVFNKESITFLGVRDPVIPVNKKYYGDLKAMIRIIDKEEKDEEKEG